MSSPEPFSIRGDRDGRVHRLTPVGELDIATEPILRAAFDAVFSDGDTEMIVVGLGRLEFMDSTGIGLLLEMSSVCEHTDRLRVNQRVARRRGADRHHGRSGLAADHPECR